MQNLKFYTFFIASMLFINNGIAQTKQTADKSVLTAIRSNGAVAKKGEMTEAEIQAWPHMDIIKDSVPGMSLQKAYDFLADKKGEKVIVAIIDSGIDIKHEDLKEVIWTNTKEIPNNGIDDDKNGYVDDINGWNFLGSKKGSAYAEQLEMTRIVKKSAPKFEGKLPIQIEEKDQKEFELYLKLSNEIKDRKTKAYESKMQYESYSKSLKEAHKNVTDLLKRENYTIAELDSLATAHEDMQPQLFNLMRIIDGEGTIEIAFKYLEEGIAHFTKQYTSPNYDILFDGRAVVGDNPDDFNDRNYGNPNVLGVDEEEIHGTHVTGIVAAVRNNGIGMNGVTNNVKIMSIRAVPDGDEYDKDIALAIRYAVDNGAKVINMSFGKSYSPQKEWVYDAIKYAAGKNVLLVHAAGNDSKNIDKEDNFPNDSDDKINEFADNVITIGAITRQFDENLAARFSNYGKRNVDLFAPGLEIYSTFPKNKYESIQGTSMATPQVAGVAALIRSYYPKLSASEVKQILMDSGVDVPFNVILPGTRSEKVPFTNLSVSGRILNAYNALLMAQQKSK
ncbi:MAG: S8 family peptidase [Flavobacteriaceae bacterium]|nr:S8 family peptidase [Flavobacteriaceae bacterium]